MIYGKDDMVSQLLRDSDNSVLQLSIVDLIHILDTASSARGGLLCIFLQLALPFSKKENDLQQTTDLHQRDNHFFVGTDRWGGLVE